MAIPHLAFYRNQFHGQPYVALAFRRGAALAFRQAASQAYEHHVAQIAAFEPAATAADYGIAQALKP